MEEVEALEAATEELWAMCLQAVTHMATTMTDERLGLPPGSLGVVRRSIEADDPALYARFDLAYGTDGSIKMLEINGDTPTGLVETGIVQWNWMEDVMPEMTSGTPSTTGWSPGGASCGGPGTSTATGCTSSTTWARRTPTTAARWR